MNMKKSLNVRELTRAALIAAIYCVVTILWPFSFGSICLLYTSPSPRD